MRAATTATRPARTRVRVVVKRVVGLHAALAPRGAARRSKRRLVCPRLRRRRYGRLVRTVAQLAHAAGEPHLRAARTSRPSTGPDAARWCWGPRSHLDNDAAQIKSNQHQINNIKSNQHQINNINQINIKSIISNQINIKSIISNQIISNQIKSKQIKSNQIKCPLSHLDKSPHKIKYIIPKSIKSDQMPAVPPHSEPTSSQFNHITLMPAGSPPQ